MYVLLTIVEMNCKTRPSVLDSLFILHVREHDRVEVSSETIIGIGKRSRLGLGSDTMEIGLQLRRFNNIRILTMVKKKKS